MLRVYKIQSVSREKKRKKRKNWERKGGGKNSSGYFQVGYFRVRHQMNQTSSNESCNTSRVQIRPYLFHISSPPFLPSFLSFFFLIRAHQRKTRGEEKKIAVKSKDAAIAIETRRGESRPRPFKRIPFKLSKRARNVLLIRELAGRKLRGQSSPSCWREPAILQLENRCLLYKETS